MGNPLISGGSLHSFGIFFNDIYIYIDVPIGLSFGMTIGVNIPGNKILSLFKALK
jgi:hypothetical protein